MKTEHIEKVLSEIDESTIDRALKERYAKMGKRSQTSSESKSPVFSKRMVVIAAAAVLLICSMALIIPLSLRNTDPVDVSSIPDLTDSKPAEGNTSTPNTKTNDIFPTGDESSAAEEIPTEPPAWTHIFMENYAIYKILEKTDETIQFPRWDGITWQKYGCEIVYMFPEEDYWQEPQPGDVDETGLGFGEQHNDEIWIPETESEMISDGMYLLISPKKYHLNNKEYWMPDICDGKTEYLRFLDGKLSVPEGALDKGAFSYLKAVNAVGEDYRASSSEWVAILSQLRFSDGLSVEETTEYFEKVKEAFSALKPKP